MRFDLNRGVKTENIDGGAHRLARCGPPNRVTTLCPARGPKAIRYVTASARSGRSVRASSASESGSASQAWLMSSTITPWRVSIFMSRAVTVCDNSRSAPSVGAAASMNSDTPRHLCGTVSGATFTEYHFTLVLEDIIMPLGFQLALKRPRCRAAAPRTVPRIKDILSCQAGKKRHHVGPEA